MVGCLAGVDPMRHRRLFKEECCAPIESKDDGRKQKTAVCGMWCPDEGFFFFFWFTDLFFLFFLSVPVRTRDAGCGRSCAESLLAKRVGAAVPWVKVYIFQLLAFILERPESCPGLIG